MITTQAFGRTGHLSTRTLFGAAALSQVTQDEADRTLDLLLHYGVNHIDTAASYGDAELRIGPWMKAHRHTFFLATKTEKRTYQEAKEELQRSLERLRVDSVDLWQMHVLVKPEEWEIAMGPGGALEAFLEAREQGLTRFLGVTGHGLTAPAMHLRSLERFDFDSVLFPYNYVLMQNPQYAADVEKLLKVCQEKQVAVQTIKSLTRGPWGEKEQTRATWYEPLEDQRDIDLAVHWVLSRSQLFLNTVADIHLLPKVLDAAARFQVGPSDDAMQDMAQRLGMTSLFVD
ncbi:aldo/keto reductase [Candidatus Vecturithrix granuli]|uniref:Aldo/keto reductase n=1 Tax=Vecturithrix granuli TaxID=1499967 RepID=A0A0S6WA47_VECG1|nr:aldo/keto reductase [Candidatus Vecturithrix granuli]